MWCFVAVVTTYVFGSLLTARGELRDLNRMAAVGAVANIGLNLVLIPRWQAEGAAWASLLTQMGMAVVQLLLCRRAFRLPGLAPVLLRAAAYAAGGFAVLLLMRHAGAGIGWAALAFALFMPLWAFATGTLRMGHLRQWPSAEDEPHPEVPAGDGVL
jgi:O-antigen/teichoic acid export membrane protein